MDLAGAGKLCFKVCQACLKVSIETGHEGICLFKLGPPLPPCVNRKRKQNAGSNCRAFCNDSQPRYRLTVIHGPILCLRRDNGVGGSLMPNSAASGHSYVGIS